MEILTEFQEKLLREISLSSLRDNFFLTEGTCLSVFYLKHRYSDDLDFFTALPGQVRRIVPVINKIAEKLSASVEIRRSFNTFMEGIITSRKGESVVVHFAEDAPYRIKPLVLNKEYKIYIDNLVDIACNKFSALFDRHEMKDFVDIYFIDKEAMKFNQIYTQAKNKHVGMDDYWLSQALMYINELMVLPRMVKPVRLDELQDFFNQKIKELMHRIEKAE